MLFLTDRPEGMSGYLFGEIVAGTHTRSLIQDECGDDSGTSVSSDRAYAEKSNIHTLGLLHILSCKRPIKFAYHGSCQTDIVGSRAFE